MLLLQLVMIIASLAASREAAATVHPVFVSRELAYAPLQGEGVCGKSGMGANETNFEVHAWPPRFTSFLSQELTKFPLQEDVLPWIDAVYLAYFFEAGQLSEDTQGLTCFNKRTNKYVIVINASLLAQRENREDYDSASYDDTDHQEGLVSMPGDLLLKTFFHELFHVYDAAILVPDDANKYAWSIRNEFIKLSWSHATKLKFPMPMTKEEGYPPPSKWAKAITAALTNSNFFSAEATANPAEDFAHTLEAYYMGTRYKQWEKISLRHGKTVHFLWDVRALVTRSPLHVEKLVFVGKYIFGEDFFDFL